jgi:hypothetical protein
LCVLRSCGRLGRAFGARSLACFEIPVAQVSQHTVSRERCSTKRGPVVVLTSSGSSKTHSKWPQAADQWPNATDCWATIRFVRQRSGAYPKQVSACLEQVSDMSEGRCLFVRGRCQLVRGRSWACSRQVSACPTRLVDAWAAPLVPDLQGVSHLQ